MANLGHGFGMDNSALLVVYSKDGEDSSLSEIGKVGCFWSERLFEAG
jgi:hypothetical protein